MRLGRYELESVLGRGASGVVWRARHVATSMPVAIKVLGGAPSEAEQELRAVCALEHAHVVPLYDAGRVSPEHAGEGVPAGAYWLAYEFVSGSTLEERSGELDWPALRAVLLAVLSGLAAAHARDVVHLDIKPANVLLGPGGWSDARITDFGVAVSFREHSQRVVTGTPLYMAPEQFRGSPAGFGPWTDVYAVGCMAFALATGIHIVTGRELEDFAWAHAHARFEVFAPQFNVPAGLMDWLESVLVHRVGSAASAARSLAALGHSRWVMPASIPSHAPKLIEVECEGMIYSAFQHAGQESGLAKLPESWPDERPIPPPTMTSAFGLQLARLRPPNLVGQLEQQSRLWEAFREVHDFAVSGVVWLNGPEGSGRDHLIGWLERCVEELGVGHTIRMGADADCAAAVGSLLQLRPRDVASIVERAAAMGFSPEVVQQAALLASSHSQDWPLFLQWLRATAKQRTHLVSIDAKHPQLSELLDGAVHQVLWVVRAHKAPADPDTELVVPPLHHWAIASMVRSLAPLEPLCEAELIRCSGRRPRVLLEALRHAAGRGQLRSTDRGHRAKRWEMAPSQAKPIKALQALSVSPSPVPEGAAYRVLGGDVAKHALEQGDLWLHDGWICFTSDAARRATEAQLTATERRVMCGVLAGHLAEAAEVDDIDQWHLLDEASRLAEAAGEQVLRTQYATTALLSARLRVQHRGREALAFRARAGDVVSEGQWKVARLYTDWQERRVDAARVRLDAVESHPDLHHLIERERARAMMVAGDHEGAAALMQGIAPPEHDMVLRGSWFLQLGAFLRGLWRRDEAAPALKEAYDCLVRTGRHERAGFAALWLAEVCPEESEAWLALADERFTLVPSPAGRVVALDYRAHQCKEDWEKALPMHQQCYRAKREQGVPGALLSLMNIAMCLTGLGRGREASEMAERAFLEATTKGYTHAALAALTGVASASALHDEPSGIDRHLDALEPQLGPQKDPSFARVLQLGLEACEERELVGQALRFRTLIEQTKS